MRIAICGSMTFAKEMINAGRELEKKGYRIIMPPNIEKYAGGAVKVENKWEKIELDLIRGYYEEIKKVDAILVVNKDKNGIKNYVGGNSLIEIAFAYVLNKKIFLLNPIPQMSYKDEIEAMNPVVLNEDLNI